jgi:hypothetical protein
MQPSRRIPPTGLAAFWISVVLLFCRFPDAVAADDVVSTVVVTVTGTAPAPTSSQDERSYTSESRFKQDILQRTNFYRQRHNATALKWSDNLADYAQSYAAKCIWEHSVSFRLEPPANCRRQLIKPSRAAHMARIWPRAMQMLLRP